MAENPTPDPPIEPVVPQARSGANSGEEPRPRKRATKSTKRASRTKDAKVADAPTAAGEVTSGKPAGKPTSRKSASGKPVSGTSAEGAAERPVRKRGPRTNAAKLAAPQPTTDGPTPGGPPQEGTAEPPAAEASAAGAAPGVWAAAAWEAVRHLDQPPERLARLAVADLGPRAAEWVAWLRRTYPDAPAAGIARLASRQATRYGWGLTVLEVGGPLTAPVSLPATAWVRATLVLRIAAAYGHDPTDPRRAPELLELLQLTPEGAASDQGPIQVASRRLGAALLLLGRFRRRRGGPVGTATRALLVASERGDGLDALAHRAIRRYRSADRASTG